MDLEMVLNELSLLTPAGDIQTARQWMSELISTLRQATTSGVNRVLRTQSDINLIELAPGYSVVRWRNDLDVDQEERRFFRTLTAKAPFWTDVIEEIKNDFDLSEVLHQGERARGLGFALVSDSLAVSLPSESRWDCSRLVLNVTQVDESEELIDKTVELVHASRGYHVQEHTDWISKRISIEVSDGFELWNRRAELFPRLIFCSHVSKQLENLKSGDPMLGQVKSRLSELEDYCKIWISGSFNQDNLKSKASPESHSRLNQFREKLTFRCPDGEERRFSWHVRMTPGAWRLYFFVDLEPGNLIIGYIGSKIL